MPTLDDDGWSGARWDASRVAPGQLVLMPSMRFGLLHSRDGDGRHIFIAADGSCLLCPHGEKASTVAHWCLQPREERTSCCDCQTPRGLFAKNPQLPADAPPMPPSVFDHLVAIGAPAILIKGREARQLPYTSGDRATFLTSHGELRCRHGRTRAAVLDKRNANACTCRPVAFPHRTSLVGMQLGRFGGRYGNEEKAARRRAEKKRKRDGKPAPAPTPVDIAEDTEVAEDAEVAESAAAAAAAEPRTEAAVVADVADAADAANAADAADAANAADDTDATDAAAPASSPAPAALAA